jgi:hypothetical protein
MKFCSRDLGSNLSSGQTGFNFCKGWPDTMQHNHSTRLDTRPGDFISPPDTTCYRLGPAGTRLHLWLTLASPGYPAGSAQAGSRCALRGQVNIITLTMATWSAMDSLVVARLALPLHDGQTSPNNPEISPKSQTCSTV